MICREADEQDLGRLAQIAHDTYHTVFAPMLPACDWSPFDIAHFARRLGQARARIRVVDADPLGFALLGAGHIDMLFIARAAQGRGAGRVLLRDAVDHGARSLETFAVNHAARRFYEGAGWHEAGSDRRPFAGVPCDFVRYEYRMG